MKFAVIMGLMLGAFIVAMLWWVFPAVLLVDPSPSTVAMMRQATFVLVPLAGILLGIGIGALGVDQGSWFRRVARGVLAWVAMMVPLAAAALLTF